MKELKESILVRGREVALAMENEIRKVVFGPEVQHLIDVMITAVFVDSHVLVEAPVGLAKTLTCNALALTVGGKFNLLQFTPDMLPMQITGFTKFNQKTQEFEVEHGPLHGANVFLADEINRATPKTQSAMLGAMSRRELTIGKDVHPLEQVFLVLATSNPMEHEGTYDLPEAELDRFMARVTMDRISVDTMVEVLSNPDFMRRQSQRLEKVKPVTTPEEIVEIREAIFTNIHIERRLLDYVANLVAKTWEYSAVEWGSSPRGAEFLAMAAMVAAFREGLRKMPDSDLEEYFVTPEDIERYAIDVLAHRIFMKDEARYDPKRVQSPADVVREVLNAVKPD